MSKCQITKEQFEDYIQQGYSRKDICDILGVSGTTLTSYKKKLGISLEYKLQVIDISIDVIIDYIQRKYSRSKAAKELGINITTLQAFCDKYDVHFPRVEKDSSIIDMRRLALNSYRVGARSRGLEFSLTESYFYELVIQPCVYCGDFSKKNVKEIKSYTRSVKQPFRYTGIDRVDSSKGYTVENSVPCCSICNRAKKDMDSELFKQWIENLVKFHQQC